jgi:FG-GAP-like repeat
MFKLFLALVFVAIMPATTKAISPLTAVATTTNVNIAGGTSYFFTVAYVDENHPIDVGSCDSGDVRVTGPGGFNVAARFVGVAPFPRPGAFGRFRIVIYSIVPPGGTWNFADNGTYNVVMQASQVFDGFGNAVAAGNIGSFTVAVPTPSTDFNNDGKPDYVLYNSSTRQTVIWYLNNNVLITGRVGPTISAGWSVAGVGDFNRDSHPDYLLFNPSTRQTVIAYLNNNVLITGRFGPTLPAGWSVAGAADFNGDGHLDYLLFNPGTGQTVIWYLNNNVLIVERLGPILPAGWSVAGVGDFNGDGRLDYLLFNPGTGQTVIWYLNNSVLIAGRLGPILPAGWSVAGAADFNGDGHPHYLLFNPGTGQTVIWYLNNNVLIAGRVGPTLPAGWIVVAP